MKRIILPLVFAIPFVLLIVFLLSRNQEKFPEQQAVTEKLHSTIFFEPHNFYQGVNSAKDLNLSFDQNIMGGIVPHHLLASELLSDFFIKLGKQAPEVVILVGPNHEAKGKGNILTSTWDWETPFGNVNTDSLIINNLVDEGFVNDDNETVGNEHSVGGMMPYLAYYLPETKIVPIILSSPASLSRFQILGNYLAQVMADKNWVVVASVDFAHEVTSQEAEVNDAISENLTRQFDIATLFTLGNEYLDSAPAVGMLLQVMQGLGARSVEVLNHTNSGFLFGGQPSLVTSYFETIFYKTAVPSLTIDRVFSTSHELTSISQDELRTLIVTGDVLLARSVNYQMHKQKNFKLPFENVAKVLQDADLTIINLESPIIDNCPLTNEGMVFCGSPQAVEGLIYAGVDIASVANNHCWDRGEGGLQQTVEILQQNKIGALTQGEILIREVRGLKFAFLGYDTIRVAVSDDEIRDSIKKVKALSDVVTVYFHWGVEYVGNPTQKQKDLAHLAIDSGADLVLGSHPHWVQGVEIYKDKLITYSHGNFIFDQMWSEETKTGVIGKYTFYKEKLVDVEFLPVYMENFPSPHLLTGNEKKEVLDIMQQRSILE